MSLVTFLPGPAYRAAPRDPQPWVIRSLVPVGGLVNIYGKPKSFKSYLALGMAFAVANGADEWNGFEVLKQGRVAYLQIDTPRSNWAGRIDKLAAAGFDDSNILFADLNTVPYPYNVLEEKHYLGLKQALAEWQPVMVIIDTLRESFSGDENDSNTMRNVITNIVAATRPSSVILLSHQRKDGVMQRMNGGEDLMDDNRGSSYIPGRMDVIIKMTGKRMIYQGRSTPKGVTEVEFVEPGVIRLANQEKRFEAGSEVRQMIQQLHALIDAPDPKLLWRGKLSMRAVSKRLAEQRPEWGKDEETIRKWPEFLEAFKQLPMAKTTG